jgi:hypothetical protein
MNPNANTDQILIDKREDLTTMKRRLYALFLGFGLAMAICSLPQRVQAALGGSVDSILSDRKALASVHHVTTVRNGYIVQEIDNGTTVVREYISPSGIIFGIAWNGLTHPDLTQLMDSYFGEYQEALKQTPRKQGRGCLQVKTDRVVVEKWGHRRNLQGRTYVPTLIPAGVSVDEIK